MNLERGTRSISETDLTVSHNRLSRQSSVHDRPREIESVPTVARVLETANVASSSRPCGASGTSSTSEKGTLVEGLGWSCSICTQTFRTKIGLGLHWSKKHIAQNNDLLASAHKAKNYVRWSREEVSVTARAEAEIILEGRSKFVNLRLVEMFPDRSLESIKGQRRTAAYRSEVIRQIGILKCARDERGALPESSAQSRSNATPSVNQQSEAVTPDPDSPDAAAARGISLNQLEARDLRPDQQTGVNDPWEFALDQEVDVANITKQALRDLLLTKPEKADKYGWDVLKAILTSLLSSERLTMNDWETRIGTYLEKYILGANVLSKKNKRKSPRGDEDVNKEFPTAEGKTSRKLRRRAQYKLLQDLYNRDRKAAADYVFKGSRGTECTLPSDEVFDFWKSRMSPDESPTFEGCLDDTFHVNSWASVFNPITDEEIIISYPARASAPGPDGLTSISLMGIPTKLLRVLYNSFMLMRDTPRVLKKGRTALIAKTDSISGPGDFRPITVASVMLRHFHKILSGRLGSLVCLDPRQRAFIPCDGCFENVSLFYSLLKDARMRRKELQLAILDVQKAFDTVRFSAVFAGLIKKGCPPSFIEYLSNYYRESSTVLTVGGNECEISPTRGVRQGDPLSPLLFNVVLDGLFDMFRSRGIFYELPSGLEQTTQPNKINALAFADDVVLVASSKIGLQQLLDLSVEFLAGAGMTLNVSKCTSLSLIPLGGIKKLYQETEPWLRLGPEFIRPIGPDEHLKYLGVRLNSRGKPSPHIEYAEYCKLLGGAPLKPQQRLFILKAYVLPKFIYPLVMGEYNKGRLISLDREIRKIVRRWLDFPHDIPKGVFYSSIRDGGLGLPSYQWFIPMLKVKRYEKMLASEDQVFSSLPRLPHIARELARCRADLDKTSYVLNSTARLKQYYKYLLTSRFDGAPLKEAGRVPGAHQWVSDGRKFLSGEDFIKCLKARYNALPTRSRCARGRNKDTRCRAGCVHVETLNHISQWCPRTHGGRVKRHNNVLGFLTSKLRKLGYQVAREACLKTNNDGALATIFPDLICTKNGQSYVLDAHVTGDGGPSLNIKAELKIQKYASNKDLESRLTINGKKPIFGAITLSWRGLIAPSSAKLLEELGFLVSDYKFLATRTIQGTVMVFNLFNRSLETVRGSRKLTNVRPF